MHFISTPFLVLLLSLMGSTFALAQPRVGVVVTPPSPTENDVISVEGHFGIGGFVKTHSHSIAGNIVKVRMVQDGPDFGPNPPFTFHEPLGRLSAGAYTVEIAVETGLSNNPLISTQSLLVRRASAPAVDRAVEYFSTALNHYFVTSNIDEMRDLDAGVHQGWIRTGQAFNVYRDATIDTIPVCRYYITPAWGDSHFLSASRDECAGLNLVNYVAAWNGYFGIPRYLPETQQAFYVALPAADGSCPPGWMPIFRLWNARADSGHRYTTDPQIKATMLARGYVAEGNGPAAVAMCSPP